MSVLDVDRSAAILLTSRRKPDNSSSSLDSTHIHEALHCSKDAGVTLQFSRLDLSEVGIEVMEELAAVGRQIPDDESIIQRLALDHNRLTTLPMEFALLDRVRYLNLKHNNFTSFPNVLNSMPSLDTLDISHNKIKRFPFQPGNLIHLRVLRLSRNKVTRLPSYLMQFQKLDVLQIDRNPIEWPPRDVMANSGLLEGQEMKEWIRNVQQWIGTETTTSTTNEDSSYNEQQEYERDAQERYTSWRFPIRDADFGLANTSHSRTFSVDSSISLSSIPESLQAVATAKDSHGLAERPPALHLGILHPGSSTSSPTRSIESYLPSPAESDTFDIDTSSSSDSQGASLHNRTASYADVLPNTIPSVIPGQKSLPDLRTAQLNIVKRGKIPDSPEGVSPLVTPNKNRKLDDFSVPPPLPHHQDSGPSLALGIRITPLMTDIIQSSPTSAVPSMSFERNSYFRRLSTFPTTHVLPKPLLCLVESARTILFVLCQVYNAIEHYAICAIDERLSSVLMKVLDPASADMMQLIRSLDRFDAVSRKMLPPPAVCRGVVEGCRDTVAAFRKALGVLTLQLKVISASDDVRFSRWILLELYAASAEISCAWRAMLPHIDSMKPLLHSKSFSSQNPSLGLNNSDPQPSLVSSMDLPSGSGSPSYSGLRLRPLDGMIEGGTASAGRARTARRHAGSFSSKDVEIGKQLPSYDDDVPSLPGGVVSGIATQTPTLRTPKRQVTVPLISTSVSRSPQSSLMPSFGEGSNTSHSRHGSHGSQFALSSSSSPSIPPKAGFLELPTSSRTQVDKEALHAVQEAVKVAPSVWNMMEDALGDMLKSNTEVREDLERARIVTKRLFETIQIVQEGDSVADRKALRDDAHSFLKTVVNLSKIMKAYGKNYPVTSTLRSNMIKLTNATEEFAILLHVSSYSPLTPRTTSPMLNLSSTQANSDDNRLGSSLSRASRSAQASPSYKLPLPTLLDGPRSALPTQSFKLPTIRRLRSAREARAPTADPG